ncbi:uncharacterized protein BT62DRAFT_46819 [Guyanagaster necrorhizus]|uniref:F-box domain-containing protein n=1 Tax=Guyanagaster necrorhizus TaxID=856835 RepID=A0A9P8AZB6_9AGAR|nr:uncharacterized protein BT62DRAFT_46819 [Guyanagaster necrorhizus MCA 3950]KAG7453111.1 hypothetical protein BT62DRAFT_46819 [Guyanagaster necrorhizus MCA 3950]
MSAKQYLSRNKPTCVGLPPEIWQLIFDWTTQVPGAYDPDCLAWSFTHPPSKSHIQDTKKSLRSRSRLVRVCKLWNVLALKNLFEHITIVNDASILSLRKVLVQSREDAETGHHLGCYTKRLDVCFKTNNVNKTITDLSDVIACLPNLSFIKLSLTNADRSYANVSYGRDRTARPCPLIDALCTTCPSLEVLEITPQSYIPQANDVHRLFSSFPKLRSFRNVGRIDDLLAPQIPFLHIATSLTTFAIYDPYFKVAPAVLPPVPSTFPSLQTVMFYTSRTADRQFLSFLRIHGSTLTTVMIRFSMTVSPQIFLCVILDTIGASCPRVVNFMIWFDAWYVFGVLLGLPSFQMPPSIRVFGIRCKELQADSRTYEKFLSQLKPENGRILRLLDERHVKDLCQKHAKVFNRARRRLESGGWQFQGPDERVLL